MVQILLIIVNLKNKEYPCYSIHLLLKLLLLFNNNVLAGLILHLGCDTGITGLIALYFSCDATQSLYYN